MAEVTIKLDMKKASKVQVIPPGDEAYDPDAPEAMQVKERNYSTRHRRRARAGRVRRRRAARRAIEARKSFDRDDGVWKRAKRMGTKRPPSPRDRARIRGARRAGGHVMKFLKNPKRATAGAARQLGKMFAPVAALGMVYGGIEATASFGPMVGKLLKEMGGGKLLQFLGVEKEFDTLFEASIEKAQSMVATTRGAVAAAGEISQIAQGMGALGLHAGDKALMTTATTTGTVAMARARLSGEVAEQRRSAMWTTDESRNAALKMTEAAVKAVYAAATGKKP